MSEVLGDTSWKIPSSSNILMRASQVSSVPEPENQSYLRISLGEFFQRRSEALGCLGSSEEDNVKRVRTFPKQISSKITSSLKSNFKVVSFGACCVLHKCL